MFFHRNKSEDWSRSDNDELWSAIQEGDRTAFSELFSRFYSRLFLYGTKLISDQEAVKDGIQELFLSLWRHRQKLADAESIEFYLLYSFRRILFKEKKRLSAQQKRNWKYGKNLLRYEFSIEKQIIHIETKEERHEMYRKALQTLTDRQSESLRLRMEHGLDNREIAEVMNISEKRVRNLIYEATKKLREWVDCIEPIEVNMN